MKKVLLLLLLILIVGCSNQECITQEKYNLLEKQYKDLQDEIVVKEKYIKYFQKAKDEHILALLAKSDAERYFNLWVYYYDEGMFSESIGFCVEARDYYAESNSFHQKAIQYFANAREYAVDEQVELVDAYIDYSNITIDINWAMYEACEYFESASKYYSNELWEAGDNEREKANERIRKHDSLIKKANEYNSKITVLEEEGI